MRTRNICKNCVYIQITYPSRCYTNPNYGKCSTVIRRALFLLVGMWVRGKRHGSGEILYSNHHFHGKFLDDLSVGSGKFQFDAGCEQVGEYKLEELKIAGETDEDEVINAVTPKWKCSNVQAIQME